MKWQLMLALGFNGLTKRVFSLTDDAAVSADAVRRVVLVSGKFYYALQAERDRRGLGQDTAIVRVESLCPFPAHDLNAVLAKYSNANSE